MDHIKLLEKAIAFIENNLGSIGAEDVARETGYSYYHLTRIFTAVIGEPVGSYIKKRRLADAAQKLLYTDKRVIDIALENGFDTPEAFSRAFKAAYRVSPAVYRKNRLDLIIGAKRELKPELLRHLAMNVTVRPKILKTGEIRIAGLRGMTTIKQNVIPKLWADFLSVREHIPNTSPKSRAFGVCESGETVYSMDGDAAFNEFVGIGVSSFEGMPPGIEIKTLRAGRYAVFTHTGSLKRLQATYDYIWGTWIPNTSETLDSREDFEVYDERFLGYGNPKTEVDIYIPLK